MEGSGGWKKKKKGKTERYSANYRLSAARRRMIMSARHWERPTFSFQPPHADGGTYQRADTRSETNSQQSERRRIFGFMTIPVRGFFSLPLNKRISWCQETAEGGAAALRGAAAGRAGGVGAVRKIGILTCVIDTRVCPRGIHICRDLNGGL